MPDNLQALQAAVDTAVLKLADVEQKRMFGCPAYFTNGNIFALVWKHGRIGVKLPDEKLFTQLMAMPGAEPWTPAKSPTRHWVLVAPQVQDDPAALKTWLGKAHRLAGAPVKKKKKETKAKRIRTAPGR